METQNIESDDIYRQFGGTEDITLSSSQQIDEFNQEKDLKYVHDGIIGSGKEYITPFGTKRCIYTDWTASGRAFIQVLI
jgi:hypothetical protein